jgi:NADPH:quinone reductase-like Zn-dependent oxidoreductase
VWVTTSGADKLARAQELGARGGVDRREPDWDARLLELAGGPVDVAVDSAGADWPRLLATVRRGGRLVSFGRTVADQAEVAISALYFGQKRIQGTTMGSPREFDALLAHVEGAAWRPVIDAVLPLEKAPEAYARLDAPDRFGKVVLGVRR